MMLSRGSFQILAVVCCIRVCQSIAVHSSDCGTPPDAYQATVDYGDTLVGSQANYTCVDPDVVFLETRRSIFVADCYYAEEEVYGDGVLYYVARWNATNGCLATCPYSTQPAYMCWYYTIPPEDRCNPSSPDHATMMTECYAYCKGCRFFPSEDHPCEDNEVHAANCPGYKDLGYCETFTSFAIPYCTMTCGCFNNTVPAAWCVEQRPVIDNAHVVTDIFAFKEGDQLQYECDSGYQFPDATTSKVLATCATTASGTNWMVTSWEHCASETTPEPTTEAATTQTPTTEAATTQTPTTEAATTQTPTTEAATTQTPTTEAATTQTPTTEAATTQTPTTEAPTTQTPTTEAATTQTPTTEAAMTQTPTTEAATTQTTTTKAATTQIPTTEAPTTQTPTTEAATTQTPTTETATTQTPTTEAATTQRPTTEAATTQTPTTEAPTTQTPTTEAATTQTPTTESATTQTPTAEAATTQTPTADSATTQTPTTELPTTQKTTAEAGTTQEPTTEAATAQEPTTKAETTQKPTITASTQEATDETATTQEKTSLESETSAASTRNQASWTTEESTMQESTIEVYTTQKSTDAASLHSETGSASLSAELYTTVGPLTSSDAGQSNSFLVDVQSAIGSTLPPMPFTEMDVRTCYWTPPKTLHAHIDEVSSVNAAWARYTCHAGYVFPEGGTSRTLPCIQHSVYEVDCQAKHCPPVPEVSGATKDTSSTRVGTVVTYTCKGQRRFTNGRPIWRIKCGLGMKWSDIPAECRERCHPLPAIENATALHYTGDYATHVDVTCFIGHHFEDGTKRKRFYCSSDGLWEDVFTGCRIDVCPALALAQGTTISTNIAIYGTVVTVACDLENDVVKALLTLECLDGGVWNDTMVNCTDIRCEAPPVVADAQVEGNDTLYGTEITYTCPPNTRTEQGHTSQTIACNEYGQWTIPDINCADDRCPPVPLVENASPSTHTSLEGSKVKYTCYYGYIFPDGTTTYDVTCAGGSWGIMDVHCSPVDCGKYRNIANGAVSVPATTFTNVVTVECIDGYVTSEGNQTMTSVCLGNGKWAVPDISCSAISCQTPPLVMNGHISSPLNYTYTSTLTYSCRNGYWFARGVWTMLTSCTAQGTWEPSLSAMECQVVQCPGLPSWSGLVSNTSDVSPGTVANISCLDDVPFDNSLDFMAVTCGEDGEWSPSVPECDYIPEPPFEPEPVEAKNSKIIGSICVATLAGVSVFLLCVDIPTIYTVFTHIHPQFRMSLFVSKTPTRPNFKNPSTAPKQSETSVSRKTSIQSLGQQSLSESSELNTSTAVKIP